MSFEVPLLLMLFACGMLFITSVGMVWSLIMEWWKERQVDD